MFAKVQYNGGGRAYAVPFSYISRAHVSVYVDGTTAAFSWLMLQTINATSSFLPAK